MPCKARLRGKAAVGVACAVCYAVNMSVPRLGREGCRQARRAGAAYAHAPLRRVREKGDDPARLCGRRICGYRRMPQLNPTCPAARLPAAQRSHGALPPVQQCAKRRRERAECPPGTAIAREKNAIGSRENVRSRAAVVAGAVSCAASSSVCARLARRVRGARQGSRARGTSRSADAKRRSPPSPAATTTKKPTKHSARNVAPRHSRTVSGEVCEASSGSRT